jgi:asparagine synthase (glutamine-hydrolysing)
MCGIWGYLRYLSAVTPGKLYDSFEKIRPRGPDRSTFHEISEFGKELYIGFQRLAIIDPTTDGDQPFTMEHKVYDINGVLTEHRSIYVTCNGEVYNHHELAEKYGYNGSMKGHSDCEVLPYLYLEHGFESMCDMLRGETACAVLDINKLTKVITLHLGRDALNVRPLFIGEDDNGFGFSSELKGLCDIIACDKIKQLDGGMTHTIVIDTINGTVEHTEGTYFDITQYVRDVPTEYEEVDGVYKPFDSTYKVSDVAKELYGDEWETELDKVVDSVHDTFDKCVASILESDVPLGALLSGGLDSSLVVSLAAKHLRKIGKRLRTYSIGLPGSEDGIFAQYVADHVDVDHTHVEFTTEQFLNAIPEVIYAIESYDVTTVRASTGQYLISKWISENTDIKVLLQGDGSDELFGSYLYFMSPVHPNMSNNECVRLLKDIGYFDALRSDRGIASNSLEARTAFLHRDIVECVLSIDPILRVPLSDHDIGGKCKRRMEKWILRKAFDRTYTDVDGSKRSYLPLSVLYKKKDAFSDSCSSIEKSWYEIIQEQTRELYTIDDLNHYGKLLGESTTMCDPVKMEESRMSMESVHYLEIFTEYFGECYQVIPYYWMPKWINATDPSARTLDVYNVVNE